MKKFKKLLSVTLGIALSIGGFATNLSAGNDTISTNLTTYLKCKKHLCEYMVSNGIEFINFFDLRYNLDVVPEYDHQLILKYSKSLVKSLSSIGRNFNASSQAERNDIVKEVLKFYCACKGYDYQNILNVINSNAITQAHIHPFRNESIEPEILQQHGMKVCIEFARELTEDEQNLFFEYEITPREQSINFGI